MARGLAPTRTNSEPSTSILGRSTRVRGKIQGSGDLRVEGRVDGDVTVTGSLAIESGAAIVGDVDAESVTIGGALTGDVLARGPVAIRAGADVTGNMGGSEVSLEEGALFTGRIEAEFDLPAELTSRTSPGQRG